MKKQYYTLLCFTGLLTGCFTHTFAGGGSGCHIMIKNCNHHQSIVIHSYNGNDTAHEIAYDKHVLKAQKSRVLECGHFVCDLTIKVQTAAPQQISHTLEDICKDIYVNIVPTAIANSVKNKATENTLKWSTKNCL